MTFLASLFFQASLEPGKLCDVFTFPFFLWLGYLQRYSVSNILQLGKTWVDTAAFMLCIQAMSIVLVPVNLFWAQNVHCCLYSN